MVDIVITAGSVVKGANAVSENGIAGATITAGQWVYKDAATGKYLLADANSATEAARQARGVALNGAAINQPLAIQKSGLITIGGTLTPGVAYYLSSDPGGICLVADIGSAEYVCLLGLATTAAILNIDIQFPNVAL